MTQADKDKSSFWEKLQSDWLRQAVFWLPAFVIIATVLVGVISYVLSQKSYEVARNQAVEQIMLEHEMRIASMLDDYTIISRAGSSVVTDGTNHLRRWEDLHQRYNLPKYFPSIQAIGFSQLMEEDEAKTFINQRRKSSGNSNLRYIKPSVLDKSAVVRLIYPLTNETEQFIGLDVGGVQGIPEMIRDTIRHRNSTLIASPIDDDNLNLSSESSSETMLLLTPIYKVPRYDIDSATERKNLAIGMVFVSIETETFFEEVFEFKESNGMSVAIYMGDDLLFKGGGELSRPADVTSTQAISAYGEDLRLRYEFDSREFLSRSQRYASPALLIMSITAGLLLGAIIFFSMRSRQLRLSYEREREIKLAKDELLSLASHQLRTPATGVKQYMGMVLQGFAGKITDQQRAFLERAYESNERQLQVINDILHLAKLDAGRIVLAKTNFNLSDVVESVVDEQHDDAEKAKIKLTVKTPKNAKIYADAHMFRMVLENVVSNAIKYTHPGGKVAVRLMRQGDDYVIEVKDTGVGIKEAEIPLLFKQFSRISNERSHLVSGTGVGLYLAKNLMDLHGGSIEVKSREGKGSTFTIRTPRGL